MFVFNSIVIPTPLFCCRVQLIWSFKLTTKSNILSVNVYICTHLWQPCPFPRHVTKELTVSKSLQRILTHLQPTIFGNNVAKTKKLLIMVNFSFRLHVSTQPKIKLIYGDFPYFCLDVFQVVSCRLA